MKKIRALSVPHEFYKSTYFEVSPDELRQFLSNMVGYISPTGEVQLEVIDIDTTIRMHSGDCRIWYCDGYYYVLDASQILMWCDSDNYYDDIFDWMEYNIPSLYEKHNKRLKK